MLIYIIQLFYFQFAAKEQWLVHSLMEYYKKTGSARIIEVLVKVLQPHDAYILDKLAEWLKSPSQRIYALNLFCFVVRKHPTWLFKLEKHRLVKDMLIWLKQLEVNFVQCFIENVNFCLYICLLMNTKSDLATS